MTPKPETCESERDTPGRPCGDPATWRYPAMGGGYFHMCDQHGERHRSYSDHKVNGTWSVNYAARRSAPPARPSVIRAPSQRAMLAALYARGMTREEVARQTGYAISTVRAWQAGYGWSRRATEAVQALLNSPTQCTP